MSKWAICGIVMVVVGGLMLGFQKLSVLMGDGGGWDTICLVDLINPDHLNWIDSMTFWGINNLLDAIVMAPLYIILFCVGGVSLLISGFVKN